MSAGSELHTLLVRMQGLGHLKLGHGPKHPEAPEPRLTGDIAAFLERYPFVCRDEGYVQFLSEYAGGVFWRDQDALSLGLFGFYPDLSIHLTKGPGETIEHGYLTFCDLVIPPRSEPFAPDARGLGFGFDATGTRRAGVHRLWGEGRADYFCETFLEWLRLFIEHEGRLDENISTG